MQDILMADIQNKRISKILFCSKEEKQWVHKNIEHRIEYKKCDYRCRSKKRETRSTKLHRCTRETTSRKVMYCGASLKILSLVKFNIISLVKFVNIETKILNGKYFYNKLTNKKRLWFINANYFYIHKWRNNKIIKQIYIEDFFIKA